MLTGEPIPVVVAPGDEVIGATLNTTGHVRDACHAGRSRHGPGPDRGARQSCAGLQGTDPAARRPDRRDLRADRPDRRVCDVRALARRWSRAASHVRADRVRQRPRHRLPVRDGSRDADRDHGRHRSWRRGRHPHPRRRGARDGSPGHCGRHGQDGHADPWPAGRRDRDAGAGLVRRRGARRGRRPRKGQRASAWARPSSPAPARTSSVSVR